MTSYDLVVLGGGPGGSLTASLVRRQDPGKRVLVLEREKFPRHHVGESTIPSWQPILERAGVLEKMQEAMPIRKVGGRFLWGRPESDSWTLDFRDREGNVRQASFHVDRGQLDQLLLDHAASLGAQVIEQAEVTGVERQADGTFAVRWEGPAGPAEATATYVVDATGQARLLSHLWKIPVVPFDGMNNYAVWAYWKGSAIRRSGASMAEGERWTLISTCDDGWIWHIPIGPDLVSVGLVTEQGSLPSGGQPALEEMYRRNVASCPEVGELLTSAEIVLHPLARARLMTIRDWSYRCEPVCGDGWFLVGDAALFVDPILSTGLLITSNGASMAANALHTLWNDPDVDRAMLLASYDATYREAGTSFHRLARIWYSRNFKRSTWHWEAKRQRLRTGRDPWSETDAEAFYHLCVGSFADPIEGAFRGPMIAGNADRPDARIMAAHLFSPEERARLPGAVADADIAHPESGAAAREAVVRASDARWDELLASHVRVKGCTWQRREGYFTDRTMNRWIRVSYVEVRAAGSTDPFDRVVFPSWPELPEAILPRLDGSATVDQVVRDCLRGVNAEERSARLSALRQQVVQLDFGGFLEVAGRQESAPVDLPGPLKEALADVGASGWLVELDLPGETLTLRKDAHGASTVMLARDAASQGAYLRSATTRFWYPGSSPSPEATRLLNALAARFRAWEARDASAARRFWDHDILTLSVRHSRSSST
jgi:flavin-dependent dehydrogenase